MQSADEAVANQRGAGFTTLAACFIAPDLISGASNGDSAVLLLNQSAPGVLLTQNQHKNPPVGSGEAVFVPFSRPLVRPWSVLAMTDGVWKYAGWDNILRICLTEPHERMIASVRDHAKLKQTGRLQDDFTLVVVSDS